MEQLSDEDCLARIAQGDQEAFGVLYERYVGRIYNYIYYRTGDSSEAEDLTARVFLRAMRHVTTYRDIGLPFSAWLYRIAHNLVANWHRDNSRRKEVALDDTHSTVPHTEHLESELVDREQSERLIRLIKQLPAERQQLVILKFVEHLSNSEIGVIMGRSEGAIKSLYHRTLLALRNDLEILELASHINE